MTGTWASGWQDGDIVPASEFRKQVGAIYDATLGVAAASIDITSIVSTYAHLLVTTYLRGDTAATNTSVLLRFNGDAGANYDYQTLRGSAAVASASEAFAQTFAVAAQQIPAASATANVFGAGEISIPHYAGSSNNKQITAMAAGKVGTSSGTLGVDALGGSWRSNAAITRITLIPGAGNFAAGSRVTVYAMGA